MFGSGVNALELESTKRTPPPMRFVEHKQESNAVENSNREVHSHLVTMLGKDMVTARGKALQLKEIN
jgi:hypothetical protein